MSVTSTIQPRLETEGRLRSLDGLRGVAALIVLIHHTLLLMPSMVAPYRAPRASTIGDLQWWLTYTPLHLLWDGSVAVVVFFVLSGFVLCLPMAQGRNQNWLSYYPKRLIRLYVPVWGAVALSLIWPLIVPHGSGAPESEWLSGHDRTPSLGDIARDAALLFGRPGATNSALWSLKWEVIFSILLPLFVVFAAKFRGLLWLKLTVLAVALTLGTIAGPFDRPYQMTFLFHLPVFAVGCIMAFEWTRLGALARRIEEGRRNTAVWGLLAILCGLALSSYWLVFAVPSASPSLDALGVVARVIQVAGSALLLFLASSWKPLVQLLELPANQWLGTRSFSIYLVHEPLVVAAGFLLAGALTGAWPLLIVVPIALIVGELFYRGVERPSHKLANQVGRRLHGNRVGRGKR